MGQKRQDQFGRFPSATESSLPGRLRYLQPFYTYLKKLKSRDIGDTTDTTCLEELLRKRVAGMSVVSATKRLGSDLTELETYLAPPRSGDERLHFIRGFLLIAAESPEELLNPSDTQKDQPAQLTMELPPKAKLCVDQYSLTATWRRMRLHASPVNMNDDFTREFTLARLANPNASEYELLTIMGETWAAECIPAPARQVRPNNTEVHFGAAVGHKQVFSRESPVFQKMASYLLAIPNGCVSVGISANHDFDESEWEPYLNTLRFK